MSDDTRVLGGRYEIRDRLGRGGMAEVFRGYDRILERDVAVKILSPERTAEEGFVRRFRREATSAASLNHRNVVAVHDTGSDGDEHFIVMELVDGPTLDAVIARDGPFEPDRAVEVMRGIGAALTAAHERGLVHRDVKPGNIMFDADGEVKVADFGLARAVSTSTRTSTVYGSAPYIAPEQALGDDVDHRADIYALGCVLHHMLTGHAPFEGDSPLAIVSQHLHSEPPPPSSVRPDLPPHLDAIVAACIAKDPDDRYPDVAAIIDDLDRGARDDIHLHATQVLAESQTKTVAMGAVAAAPASVPAATAAMKPTDAPPPESRPLADDRRPERRSSPLIAVAALVALGISALLIILALQDDGTPEAPPIADETDVPPPADDDEPDEADEPPAEEEPTGIVAVREAALDVYEAVNEAEERDQMDKKWAEEVRKHVAKVVEEAEADDWEDARDALADARTKLNEGLQKGEVNPGRAREIHRRLDDLEASLEAARA